jgi:hypothetical protein
VVVRGLNERMLVVHALLQAVKGMHPTAVASRNRRQRGDGDLHMRTGQSPRSRSAGRHARRCVGPCGFGRPRPTLGLPTLGRVRHARL